MRRIFSFTALNVTQTLVTLVDSVFRLIVVFSLIDLMGQECCNQILSLSGVLFILPFLFFSTPAGHLADKFSKRDVLIWTMWAEVIFLFIAIFAIWMHNVFSSYLSLFLVALQAAIFSPAKYAILPEIVPEDDISRANGHMTLATYMAVIMGTFFGSFLAEISGRNYVFSTILCFIASIIGLIFSYLIEKTPAQDPQRKISFFFLRDLVKSLKVASKHEHLLLVSIAASYFLFTASYTQLNLIPFGIQSLNLSDVQSGYIYLSAALGIGLGSLFVSLVSKKEIKLSLALWGGFGTAFSYFFLYFFKYQLIPVVFLILSTGFHGGLYIVPLDAYIQVVSPKKQRGSIIAASTFLGVLAVLFAAGYLSLIGDVLVLSASTGFFFISFITLIFSFYLFFNLRKKIVFNNIEE